MPDPDLAAHVAALVDAAPPLPADALDLLRRLGCPAVTRRALDGTTIPPE
jgi:hypothetical protein